MSSSLLSLGQTVHCSVKHRWQLSSEATIQVAGIPDIALATSHLQQLELLTNRDIWMRRGHGLRLSIQILLDGEKVARAPGVAEIVESLGVSLRDGEVIPCCIVALSLLISLALATARYFADSIFTRNQYIYSFAPTRRYRSFTRPYLSFRDSPRPLKRTKM